MMAPENAPTTPNTGTRMQTPDASDFSTVLASCFSPPLQSVDVVDGLSVRDFEERYRRPRRPVIINDGARQWRALQRWSTPDHLVSVAGHRNAFVRDLEASNVEAGSYHEEYREVVFGELVERLFGEQPPAWYLTQGLIMRGSGFSAMLARRTWPAALPELAQDLTLPPYWSEKDLAQCNLWLGPGDQISGLHYDEFDNLNGVVVGSKRWILFSHDQAAVLLNGQDVRQTIAPGFHAKAENRFEGSRATARGYECVTHPGQLLYVPAGMWHQVFSGPGPSLAVNFWYLNLPRDTTSAVVLHARRYSGFFRRKRFLLALGLVGAQVSIKAVQYGFGKRAPAEVEIGPPGYGL